MDSDKFFFQHSTLDKGSDYFTTDRRMESMDGFSKSQFDYYFVIDGKRISIEDFVDLLESFEGWNFKFRIIDSADDFE